MDQCVSDSNGSVSGASTAVEGPAGVEQCFISSSSVRDDDSSSSVGYGKLSVADTRLEGTSGCGVLCAGTGAVRSVRVVRGEAAAWYFLEVDASDPGVLPAGASQLLAAAARARMCGVEAGSAARDPFVALEKASLQVSMAQGGQQQECEQQRHQQRLRQLPPLTDALGSSSAAAAASPQLLQLGVRKEEEAARAQQGLSRINALLGGNAISPALLSAHLPQLQHQAHRQ